MSECVYACVILYSFITCIDWCDYTGHIILNTHSYFTKLLITNSPSGNKQANQQIYKIILDCGKQYKDVSFVVVVRVNGKGRNIINED